jgi:DNA-binding IclR family transcriptional regulator
MSAKLLTMVFDRYLPGGGERLLALALADLARDDGSQIWPAFAVLMRRTGQSRSTVHRQIKRMIAAGWLFSEPRRVGYQARSAYRISPEWIAGEQAGA